MSADVLEKNACFVPSQEDVTRVLQHILDAINRHSSSGTSGSGHSHSTDYDQQIFLSLIKLSTHEGFCLPFKPQNSSSLSAQGIENILYKNSNFVANFWHFWSLDFCKPIKWMNRLTLWYCTIRWRFFNSRVISILRHKFAVNSKNQPSVFTLRALTWKSEY